MKRLVLLFAVTAGAAFAASAAFAQSTPALERNLRVIAPLAEDIRQKTIHIEFKSSPKLSELVSGMLASKGYKVVSAKEDADVSFMMGGAFQLAGGAREGFTTQLAELAESPVRQDAGGTNYTHQTFHGDTITGKTILTRTLSLTDIGMWLTQKTGIAGRINELVTGDPRGVCMNDCENWKRLRHIVNIPIASVKIDDKPFVKGAWSLHASIYRDKVEADSVVAEALIAALEPFDKAAAGPAGSSVADREKPAGVSVQ